MRLDRNIDGGHGNKYGLIKNRRLEDLRDANGHFPDKVAEALLVLVDAGVLDWGRTPETEFFAIRLKDRHAGPALEAYATSAFRESAYSGADGRAGMIEYAHDVMTLALRSGRFHKFCQLPD